MQIDEDVLQVLESLSEDDIGQMFQLNQHLTGLPMPILIADFGTDTGPGIYVFDSYNTDVMDHIELVHKLNLAMENSSMWLTLSDTDLQRLQLWIAQNSETIKKLFTTETPAYDLYKEFKPLTQSMNEMTNLYPRETGLAAVIYVSTRQGKHEARIKVKDGNEWVPISVAKNPKVLVEHKFKTLKTKDLKLIFQWIIDHYEILQALWNETKEPEKYIEQLK